MGKSTKGYKISNTLRKIGIDIRAKLFKEIHQSLGEDLRLMVAGGAALDPEIEKRLYRFRILCISGLWVDRNITSYSSRR